MTRKKILPSTFSREIGWNRVFTASFSFGFKTPPALRHTLGTVFFYHAVLMSPSWHVLRTSGAFLYTLHGNTFGPRADAVLAQWTVLSTSFHVGGLFWWDGQLFMGALDQAVLSSSDPPGLSLLFLELIFFSFMKRLFRNLKGSLQNCAFWFGLSSFCISIRSLLCGGMPI